MNVYHFDSSTISKYYGTSSLQSVSISLVLLYGTSSLQSVSISLVLLYGTLSLQSVSISLTKCEYFTGPILFFAWSVNQ